MNSIYPVQFVPRLTRGLIATLFLVLVNSGVQTAYASANQAIVVLGDSISAGYGIQRDQGWVSLLSQTLVEREEPWVAVNASISGETTGGGRARLAGVMAENDPP